VNLLLVTGTDTGVGKTIVTAAIAACATAAGHRVAVIKPAQTGTGDGAPTDAEIVGRLADPATAVTLASYPDPLAPAAAARAAGVPALALSDVLEAVAIAAKEHDVVLIEGAGGLLVPMGDQGWTVADLAVALPAAAVVVARAGLGTLNHTALTLAALAGRGVPALVVIGAWPAQPQLVHRANLTDLPGRLRGCLPDGVGGLAPQRFRANAPTWLHADLYGTWAGVHR
jgi:dethiobiotin synthetase